MSSSSDISLRDLQLFPLRLFPLPFLEILAFSFGKRRIVEKSKGFRVTVRVSRSEVVWVVGDLESQSEEVKKTKGRGVASSSKVVEDGDGSSWRGCGYGC